MKTPEYVATTAAAVALALFVANVTTHLWSLIVLHLPS
jgi:hypothetical protein